MAKEEMDFYLFSFFFFTSDQRKTSVRILHSNKMKLTCNSRKIWRGEIGEGKTLFLYFLHSKFSGPIGCFSPFSLSFTFASLLPFSRSISRLQCHLQTSARPMWRFQPDLVFLPVHGCSMLAITQLQQNIAAMCKTLQNQLVCK